MFRSADESLKDETRLLLLWVGSLVTLHTCVFIHIKSVVKPVSRVYKSCLKAVIYNNILYILNKHEYLYVGVVVRGCWGG